MMTDLETNPDPDRNTPTIIAGSQFANNSRKQQFNIIFAIILTIIFLCSVMVIATFRSDDNKGLGLSDKTKSISDCIDRFSIKLKGQALESVGVGAAFQLCYSITSSSLLAEEQENRNGNLLLQRTENVVLMWMVVIITISGVLLAGLQLLASFELAKTGKGELAVGGNINVTKSSVVVQSSVIGVIILSISFAFFMVFVVDVYKINEIVRDAGSPSSAASNVGQGQRNANVTPPVVASEKNGSAKP